MVVTTTLSGITDVNNRNLAVQPKLDTAVIVLPSATTCPPILTTAGSSTLTTFLTSYGIQDKVPTSMTDISINDKLKTFQASLVTADTGQDITRATGYAAINTFLTTVENSNLPVIKLVDSCLRENVQIDMKAYDAAKALADESKTRLDSIRTPEQHTSYYEGWFPIIRPMTEVSLFFIFGTALFMLLVSIMFFLSMTGVSIQIQIPDIAFNFLPPGSSTYIYAGLFAGLVGTYIAFRFKYI